MVRLNGDDKEQFLFLKDRFMSESYANTAKIAIKKSIEHIQGENCVSLKNLREHQYFIEHIKDYLDIDSDRLLIQKMIMMTYQMVEDERDRVNRSNHVREKHQNPKEKIPEKEEIDDQLAQMIGGKRNDPPQSEEEMLQLRRAMEEAAETG